MLATDAAPTLPDMPFTYILECADGTFYVGSTFNLERRLQQHSEGAGAVYTRRRRPVRLIWCHETPSIRDAYFLEKQLQGWGHWKRLALVEGRYADLPALAATSQPPVDKASEGAPVETEEDGASDIGKGLSTPDPSE